jgi:hypothetical protein
LTGGHNQTKKGHPEQHTSMHIGLQMIFCKYFGAARQKTCRPIVAEVKVDARLRRNSADQSAERCVKIFSEVG